MNSTVVPATYGYARVSKTGDATRNPETQPRILQEFARSTSSLTR